jgi:triosephosphate isomerase (TIM)
MLAGSGVGLGAQNIYWEESGAYTGEVSPKMVAEFCQYVILGHSERRAYFGETDETVNKKVKAAFANQLTPIMCVGETLDENETGRTAEVVDRQVRAGLEGLDAAYAANLVIAYEPVWAIGTGPRRLWRGRQCRAGRYHSPCLKGHVWRGTSQAVRIQYGGSVNAKNAAEYFGMPDIDGALVGGASLKRLTSLRLSKLLPSRLHKYVYPLRCAHAQRSIMQKFDPVRGDYPW